MVLFILLFEHALKYSIKEELIKQFEEITLSDIAKVDVEYYYEERDGGLYIVPTETPPWIVKNNDYVITKISSKQIQVEQRNTSVLSNDTYLSKRLENNHLQKVNR